MSITGQIILLEAGDGSTEEFTERIERIGIEPICVRSFTEALDVVADRSHIISSILIPTELPDGMTAKDVKKGLKEIGRIGPAHGLVTVSIGKAPARDERKRLRSAGVQLALWEPFDDGTLRFQMNRAVSGNIDEHNRRHTRVPTYLFARVYIGGRTKDAIVYSLSTGGAFLETPRASVNGASLDVEIRMPGQPLMVKCVVIFSNVPGNLQRPNLPMGMGVRFDGMSRDEEKSLGTYVNSRLEQLEV